MTINYSTQWHKRSFDHFLEESLPQLLADRLPVACYTATPTGRHTCQVNITLASGGSGDIDLTYTGIPQPDEDGLFEIDGRPYVVVPTASHEALDVAEICCVGEQLYAYIEERLGQAPPDMQWDAELARAWLPLEVWVGEFVRDVGQQLDTTNWISHHTHLRRLIVLQHEHVIAPGQIGLVCPFESPEGRNMGRVFTVAVGTEIRDGRLVVVDERPEARLGISASMLPFLEHNDPNRALMGANMMRQALVPQDPEPALVQTGNEPDAPDFWTGRNLLTAFVSWGTDTCADGIAISASCARRLNYPYPAEPGDKLANRHGTKGVVSRVLPDDEMPHLPDGTPVELVYSFSGLHVRMNYGQVREALVGNIARAEGHPAIVPPFHAPSAEELHARLDRAGLPASGMETLIMGVNGPPLERPSTIGWVYWNRLAHLSRPKLAVSTQEGTQIQGALECQALQDVGAYETLREVLNTRASRRPDAATLHARMAEGMVEQAGPPTPMFADLVRRLRVAGIEALLEDERLVFRFCSPGGDALSLVRPMPHPWLREHELTEIGAYTARDEFEMRPPWYDTDRVVSPLQARERLAETHARLAHMLAEQAPDRLVQNTVSQLESDVRAFFAALLTPKHMRFSERQLFSGRAVLAPGAALHIDQVGLPEEMAWVLFGPAVLRELGDEQALQTRTDDAARALDRVMARSWVIVNRAPTLSPTCLLAFHPVRDPGPAIRLHPLACRLLDADFDGDQAAIYAPVTAAAQREAGERLSISGHLARDPRLIADLLPPPEALWGLARLGMTEGGLQEIGDLLGTEVVAPNGVVDENTLGEAMQKVLARDGVDVALVTLERLMRRGLEVVQTSGASMSPFMGERFALPPLPAGDDPELWMAYGEELTEELLASTDYADPELGPQLLAIRVRERGRRGLAAMIGPKVLTDIRGKQVIARRGSVKGHTPDEVYAWIVGARKGLARYWQRWEELSREGADRPSSSLTVLARARRSERPGIVLARAAASGEIDPLTDVESRLLVGLPIEP